jgi:hypothetical protein
MVKRSGAIFALNYKKLRFSGGAAQRDKRQHDERHGEIVIWLNR